MAYSPAEIERYKWPIQVSKVIDAPPETIWSVISSPGNLEDCHPFCEKNPVDAWQGVGSRDAVQYYNGRVLSRDFVTWIDGVGYDLIIGRIGGRKSYVSWRITEVKGGAGSLSITIYPHALQKIPVTIRWIPYVSYIRPALKSYLESVVLGFDWVIRTGEPVSKDQFGSHSWFSKKDG